MCVYVCVCVCVTMTGLIPQDVILLNVTSESGVVVHFMMAYSTNYDLLVDNFLAGNFHGIPVLAVSHSENCTAFVPDGLRSMYPPALDYTRSGFSAPNILSLNVQAPFVASRSDLQFFMGSCLPLSAIKLQGYCHDFYQVTFDKMELTSF